MGVELFEALSVEEVDEAVADIALIFDIAGEVQEVVGVSQVSVDLLREFLDGVLVWDVPDHDGGPWVDEDGLWTHQEHTAFLVGTQGVAAVGVGRVAVAFVEVVDRVLTHVHRARCTFLH